MSLTPASESAAGGKGPVIQIFIVEDHAYLRELLIMYCEMLAGFRVCGGCSSSEEALERFRECAGLIPDVCLVDYSLPGMNGCGLVRELRSLRPAMLCLIISGHTDPSYVEEALDAGARGFLLKEHPGLMAQSILRALAGERVVPRRAAVS